jgi:hypothetical protein
MNCPQLIGNTAKQYIMGKESEKYIVMPAKLLIGHGSRGLFLNYQQHEFVVSFCHCFKVILATKSHCQCIILVFF